jgi:hypothetical protein
MTMLIILLSLAAFSQTPSSDIDIATALLAAPADKRANATV